MRRPKQAAIFVATTPPGELHMRLLFFLGLTFLAISAQVFGQENNPGVIATAESPDARMGVCLLRAAPPVGTEYEFRGNLKRGKGSYGSVNDILPLMAHDAIVLGANAIMNYNGSQRFGFWPWRFVRPVVTGTAIRVNNGGVFNCEEMGGVSY